MIDVTHILSRIQLGDRNGAAELLPLVYDELRVLADIWMSGERPDHTLQATALVHEAYVRLVDAQRIQDWESRGHFFAAAAESMRRILIDHARGKARLKRGGQFKRIELTDFADPFNGLTAEMLLEVDEKLQELEAEDPKLAKLVQLRVFAGLSIDEAAKSIGVSRSTAFEWWSYALAWFQVEMASDHE